MANFTHKEIKDLMKWTPKEWQGKELKDVNTCKTGAIYQGFFKKAAANWCYQVSTVLDADGVLVNVVTVFGHIVTE